eukprot:5345038-Amphidinium_carterae.2
MCPTASSAQRCAPSNQWSLISIPATPFFAFASRDRGSTPIGLTLFMELASHMRATVECWRSMRCPPWASCSA